MRRSVLGVALLALVFAGCSGSSEDGAAPAPRPPGTALTEGFVVAPGSRLVGPVFSFPEISPRGVSSRAILTVDRDPVRVYDEYVAQARSNGIPVRGSGTADIDGLNTCTLLLPDGSVARSTPPGSAVATPADGSNTPTRPVAAEPLTFPGSEAATRLDCIGGGTRPGDHPVFAGIQVSWGGPNRNVVLSLGPNMVFRSNDLGDARATPPAHLPPVSEAPLATKPGEPFGEENNGFDRGYRRFTLEAGSTVAAVVDGMSVLHIDGDADAVMKGYAAQLGDNGGQPEVREQSTSRGKVLTIANSPQGGGAAFLMTDPSRQWLLIETNSD